MSSQGISRQHLMIRVDTNTSRFNWTPRNSLVFPGEANMFLSAPYLWHGKQVPIYIITLALSSPVPRNLWAYLFCSILMIDMQASYFYPAQRFASLVAKSHKQQSLSCYFFSFQRDTLLTLQRVLHSHPVLFNSWVSSPILYCKPFQSHQTKRRI